MKNNIKELFRFRDSSVHPSASFATPLLNEDFHVAMEWRFVAFSSRNAKLALAISLSVLAQLLEKPRREKSELAHYCAGALALVTPLLRHWEEKYGELYSREGIK